MCIRDRSSGIREKAKNICELLEDPDRLEEEREKTREVRNKLSGGSYSSGGKYGGISNKGYRSEYHHSEYKPRKEKPYEERTKKTESRRKEKPKNEDSEEDDVEEYKKKAKTRTKRTEEEPKKKQTKAEPNKQLVNLLDFDDGDAGKLPSNLDEQQANMLPTDSDFGNFTSAPAVSNTSGGAKTNAMEDFWSQPAPAPQPAKAWNQQLGSFQCNPLTCVLGASQENPKPVIPQEKPKVSTGLMGFEYTAPNAPQEDFGDFLGAPGAREEKKESAKGTLLDEAKDLLDMDDLMKVSSTQNPVKPAPTTLYNALYDKPNQFQF
eukprot:TRINITY_DN1041_c0_g1_i48.p1 TRINITY_DN1041_c0_g1~~TRINITY_DN1041_c0_g1_i48.p1  ORF type:complete len:321 (-),score=95.26 TRINITY_DN1041_c0_g1_i48:50-1012(-)